MWVIDASRQTAREIINNVEARSVSRERNQSGSSGLRSLLPLFLDSDLLALLISGLEDSDESFAPSSSTKLVTTKDI